MKAIKHEGEKPLVNRYMIRANEYVCLKNKIVPCDVLGQHPEDYSGAVRIAAIYHFLYPLIAFLVWVIFFAQSFFVVLVIVFTGIFVPFFPLAIGLEIWMFITLLIIGIIIDVVFLIYLFWQIGIYALLPVFAFLLSMVLRMIPEVGGALASLVGIFPWGIIAIGVHYLHYQFSIGVVFNADRVCYLPVNKKKKFELEW